MKIKTEHAYALMIDIRKYDPESHRVHHTIRRAVKDEKLEDVYSALWRMVDWHGNEMKNSQQYKMSPYISWARSHHKHLLIPKIMSIPGSDLGVIFTLGRWRAVFLPNDNKVYRKLSWWDVGEGHRKYQGPARVLPLKQDSNKPLFDRRKSHIEEYYVVVDNDEVRDEVKSRVANIITEAFGI